MFEPLSSISHRIWKRLEWYSPVCSTTSQQPTFHPPSIYFVSTSNQPSIQFVVLANRISLPPSRTMQCVRPLLTARELSHFLDWVPKWSASTCRSDLQMPTCVNRRPLIRDQSWNGNSFRCISIACNTISDQLTYKSIIISGDHKLDY